MSIVLFFGRDGNNLMMIKYQPYNLCPRSAGLLTVPDELPEVPEGALMHLLLDDNQVVAYFAFFIG